MDHLRLRRATRVTSQREMNRLRNPLQKRSPSLWGSAFAASHLPEIYRCAALACRLDGVRPST